MQPQQRPFPIGTIRPADVDRSRVVDLLAGAFAEGRLDGAEHRRRVEAALRAHSYAELGALVADLPAGRFLVPSVPFADRPFPLPALVPAGAGHDVDGYALASLLCAVLAPVVLLLASPAAVVLGHIAMHRIGSTGGSSRSMAIAGIVIGYLEVAVAARLLLGYFIPGLPL